MAGSLANARYLGQCYSLGKSKRGDDVFIQRKQASTLARLLSARQLKKERHQNKLHCKQSPPPLSQRRLNGQKSRGLEYVRPALYMEDPNNCFLCTTLAIQYRLIRGVQSPPLPSPSFRPARNSIIVATPSHGARLQTPSSLPH